MTTFRAWIVKGGRQEWRLIEAESFEAAEKLARKKFGYHLVKVLEGAVPSKDAA